MLRYRGSVHLEGVFIWGVISSTASGKAAGAVAALEFQLLLLAARTPISSVLSILWNAHHVEGDCPQSTTFGALQRGPTSITQDENETICIKAKTTNQVTTTLRTHDSKWDIVIEVLFTRV